MTKTTGGGRRLPWGRIFAESLAIVLSILAAFAIDAWWDGRRDRGREIDLLEGLLSDFEASRPELESRIEGRLKMVRNTALFRDLLGSAPTGQTVAVPDSLVIGVIGAPTYEPSSNTLDAAVSSGEIELILSDEIRRELASWRRILIDTSEDEYAVREIVNGQLVPLLASEMRLGRYFERAVPWFIGDPGVDLEGHAIIRVSSELEGALALRHFWEDFAAQGLATLLTSLDRIVELLNAELAARRGDRARA